MGAPTKYSEELRDRAVRVALDARRDSARSRGAIRRIAEQLGVHREAMRNWVGTAEIDGGLRPGTSTSDAKRIA
ncbi:MAG: transposase, partial [Mycobacteriaceae bacterium]